MKIIHTDEVIKEKRIELPLPSVTERGEVLVPEILGRKQGSKAIPALTKELIALDGVDGLKQSTIASIHGVSQEIVSAISRGFNTTNIDTRKEDAGLRASINDRKYKIADAATSKLMTVLDLFEPSTLDQKEMPGAAVKLSSVVEKATQGFQGEQGPSVSFIVYAPRQRSEESYEIISADD